MTSQSELEMMANRLNNFLTSMSFLLAAEMLLLANNPNDKHQLAFPYFVVTFLGLVLSFSYLGVNLVGISRIRKTSFQKKARISKRASSKQNCCTTFLGIEKKMPGILGFIVPSTFLVFWILMIGHGLENHYWSSPRFCWLDLRTIFGLGALFILFGIFVCFLCVTKHPRQKIILIKIYRGEKYYIAECIDLHVVRRGKTIDEAVAEIREAINLHLEEWDIDPNFSIMANLEL